MAKVLGAEDPTVVPDIPLIVCISFYTGEYHDPVGLIFMFMLMSQSRVYSSLIISQMALVSGTKN